MWVKTLTSKYTSWAADPGPFTRKRSWLYEGEMIRYIPLLLQKVLILQPDSPAALYS